MYFAFTLEMKLVCFKCCDIISDKGQGLSITPVHAGHIIGGTAWKVVKDDEEGEIVYAVDFNHKRERHLNGCALIDNTGTYADSSLPLRQFHHVIYRILFGLAPCSKTRQL